MTTRFFSLIGLMLVASPLAVAQSWNLGGLFPASLSGLPPVTVTGESVRQVCYYDFAGRRLCVTNRYATSITVRGADGTSRTTFSTDARGRFSVRLRPGKYILRAKITPQTYTYPVQIAVPRENTPVKLTSYSTAQIISHGSNLRGVWTTSGTLVTSWPLPPIILTNFAVSAP